MLLLTAVLFFQFCSSGKKAASAPPPVTFEKDILPVVQASCAPCHITGQGKKKSLDSYAASKEYADDIIARIQKNPGERGFMPMRNPKLSDSTIALFTGWKKDGLLEK